MSGISHASDNLVLNKGMWNGIQIVSEEYIIEATSPKTYLTDKETGDVVDFYGFQWWIVNYKGHQIPYMRGILGQYIFSIPDKNAVVVRLGHERSKEYIGHHPKGCLRLTRCFIFVIGIIQLCN
jgi:CubicO group peptidase (beta-lactamase class C family)